MKVILEIGDKEITITSEEAIKLYQDLSKLINPQEKYEFTPWVTPLRDNRPIEPYYVTP